MYLQYRKSHGCLHSCPTGRVSKHFLLSSLWVFEVKRQQKRVPSTKDCLFLLHFFRRHSLHGKTSSGADSGKEWVPSFRKELGRR